MFSRVVVMASFVTLAAGIASAQDYRVEIGGNVGWTQSDGVSGQPILAGDGRFYDKIDPKDEMSWGLDIGFFVNENLEIGGLFSQQMSKMVLGGAVERELGDWNINNYHGFFAYNSGASDSRARFYVLGGLGATQYDTVNFLGVDNQNREIGGQTKFSTTWGAGVKLYPGQRFGIKLGARWTPTYIKSDAVGWWCDPYWGCYTVGDAQYSNQFEFSGGLTLRF